MQAPYERHIPFDNVFNFRDLGGYSTRHGQTIPWRRLFRSSEIHRMTGAEAAYARDHLNVRTVIDLRQSAVTVRDGTGPLAAGSVHYVNIALYSDELAANPEQLRLSPPPMVEDYLGRLKQPQCAEGIVQALHVIAEQTHGATVFHCAAGKDRTGILAAVLLSLLGVPETDIVKDYAMSARYMPRQIDHWWTTDPASPYFVHVPPYMYDARPETMEDVLTALSREYGSIRGYVAAYGGTPALFCRLEETLLGEEKSRAEARPTGKTAL